MHPTNNDVLLRKIKKKLHQKEKYIIATDDRGFMHSLGLSQLYVSK